MTAVFSSLVILCTYFFLLLFCCVLFVVLSCLCSLSLCPAEDEIKFAILNYYY